MRSGHQKEAGKLNLTTRSLGDFYPIVPSEIRSRLAIDHFLAGRVPPILILLRMAEFFKYPLALGIHGPANVFFGRFLRRVNSDHAVPLDQSNARNAERDDALKWLSVDDEIAHALGLLKPYPLGDMQSYDVSRLVK